MSNLHLINVPGGYQWVGHVPLVMFDLVKPSRSAVMGGRIDRVTGLEVRARSYVSIEAAIDDALANEVAPCSAIGCDCLTVKESELM